jgi:hypothetical protein
MFIEPIEIPAKVEERPATRTGMAAGALFILLGVILMVPYILVLGSWIAARFLIDSASQLPATLHYAGKVSFGR